MNTSKTPGTDDLLIVAVMALLWALGTLVRLVAVPVVAALVVLLTPRRRPAPQPAATAAPVALELPPATAQPVLAPVSLATIGDSLMALPARELQALTGCRRKVAKRLMVEQLLFMPI